MICKSNSNTYVHDSHYILPRRSKPLLNKCIIYYRNAKLRIPSKHFILAKYFCASVVCKFNAVEREIKKNFMAEN